MTAKHAYMSFGGGVQSTAIAMLAINRDERLLQATDGVVPDLYIFADVGDEPEALYPHVADMPDAEKRYFAALMRHMAAYQAGEVNDAESGLSHLDHAGCCLMFLRYFQMEIDNTESTG